jgi:hypothetical protein
MFKLWFKDLIYVLRKAEPLCAKIFCKTSSFVFFETYAKFSIISLEK